MSQQQSTYEPLRPISQYFTSEPQQTASFEHIQLDSSATSLYTPGETPLADDGKPSKQPFVTVDERSKKIKRVHSFASISLYTTQTVAVSLAQQLWDWWLEAGSLIVLFASLIAIIAVLSEWQNAPLSKWPFKVSINSLVAVFTFLVQATVLLVINQGISELKWTYYSKRRPLSHVESFDRASRGPVGALQLLWNLRWRYPVASFGAVVAVISIATNPISQQLVHFYSCEVLDGSQNSTLYLPHSFAMTSPFDVDLITASKNAQSVVSAFFAAGYYEQQNIRLPVDCPSGNCTFQGDYHTIGWCTSCTDVSSQLKLTQGTFDSSNATGSYINTTLGYTTVPYMENSADNKYFTTNLTEWGLLFLKPFVGWVPEKAVWSCDAKDVVTDIESPEAISGKCNAAMAVNCTIHPCVKSYTSNIDAKGVTMANIEQAAPFKLPKPSGSIDQKAVIVHQPCLNSTEKDILHSNGIEFDNSTEWIQPPLLSMNGGSALLKDVPGFPFGIRSQCFYSISVQMWTETFLQWAEFFAGNLTIGQGGCIGCKEPGCVGANCSQNSPLCRSPACVGGPFQMQALYSQGNVSYAAISEAFERIAVAMTNNALQHRDPNDTFPVPGEVRLIDTCIQIQWPWITLPIGLAIATVAFLPAMVLVTRHSRFTLLYPRQPQAQTQAQPLLRHEDDLTSYKSWKSSAMALLHTNIEPKTRAKLQPRDLGGVRGGTVQEQAAGLHVVLESTDDGWHFVEHG